MKVLNENILILLASLQISFMFVIIQFLMGVCAENVNSHVQG